MWIFSIVLAMVQPQIFDPALRLSENKTNATIHLPSCGKLSSWQRPYVAWISVNVCFHDVLWVLWDSGYIYIHGWIEMVTSLEIEIQSDRACWVNESVYFLAWTCALLCVCVCLCVCVLFMMCHICTSGMLELHQEIMRGQ